MKPVLNSQLVVWVIDDDFVSLFATRYGIEQWNRKCKVVDFDNAEGALKAFADTIEQGGEKPDIILLDLIMPNMDGWAFLSKFEKMYKGTAVPISISFRLLRIPKTGSGPRRILG